MKKLFVLGGTGGTGLAVIDQALARGHEVTAFVRSPEKLRDRSATHARLHVVKGDPRNSAELRAALGGHDAVLSALGPPGPGKTTITEDCARALVEAMHDARIKRVLVVGVAILFENLGVVAWMMRRTFLRNVANDSAEMEKIMKASDLAWTIARPPRLTDGPCTGRYGTASGGMPRGAENALATVSRADVAHFLLEELEHDAHVHQIVGLASA